MFSLTIRALCIWIIVVLNSQLVILASLSYLVMILTLLKSWALPLVCLVIFFLGGELHIMYWVKESDGKMWKEGEYSIAL